MSFGKWIVLRILAGCDMLEVLVALLPEGRAESGVIIDYEASCEFFDQIFAAPYFLAWNPRVGLAND